MREYRNVQDTKQFGIYCLYAFGSATVLTLVRLILNETSLENEEIRPQDKVLLYDMKENKIIDSIYFHFPIWIIICSNIIMFLMTACHLFKKKIESSLLRIHTNNQTHSNLNAEKDK